MKAKQDRSPLDNIENPKRTQAVVENLVLSNLLDKGVLRSIKSRLGHFGEPVVASIQIFFVPQKESDKKGQKIESLFLEQPSPTHLQARKAILTSSFSEIIDNVLK